MFCTIYVVFSAFSFLSVIWGGWTLNPWIIKVYQSIKYQLLNQIDDLAEHIDDHRIKKLNFQYIYSNKQ